ncbi:MAG: hypothetical protein KUG79_01025 [Pseudomonadales bacterium]|nr:hypothetical protein [Pseudomonadales bacterium]
MLRTNNPLIIDVEASGFGPTSYPIEVGLALDDGNHFCSLILPAASWTHWDDDAEKIHRVSRDILETYGKPMQQVTHTLNKILAGKTVYTDGWVVDKPWLTTLFFEARTTMNFQVSALEMILSEQQMERWHDTKDIVIKDLNLSRHRASCDAVIIQETFKRTFKDSQNDKK